MKKKFFSSNNIKTKKINFGFFTKNINFSFKNFKSLNKNLHSDNNNITKKKINEIQKLISLDKNKLKMISQIHSNKVVLIDNSNFENKFEADGMITQDKTISIGILTADCCPIFLFDNDASFICCLHVGWKGCYLNIIKNATKKIIKIQPNIKKITAIIGPCLNKKKF